MAFELVHELPSGITGNYWKMSSALVSCNDTPLVLVYMDLYLSRDARNEGKTPITNEYFSFGLYEVDMSYSFDFRVCLYKALKTLPRWQNAVDIFDDPNKQPIISNVSLTTNIDTDGTVDLYSWDPFNEPITYIIVSQPSNGSISLNGKTCTYTPNADFYGTDEATYKTNNGTLDSEIATISITVHDTPDRPVANYYSVATEINVPVILDLEGIDPNDLPLTFTIVNQTANGVISESGGIFTYTPNTDYIGADSGSFKVSNEFYESLPVAIDITVTDIIVPDEGV